MRPLPSCTRESACSRLHRASALSSASAFLPPAHAMSARPPPPPPTMRASSPMRSFAASPPRLSATFESSTSTSAALPSFSDPRRSAAAPDFVRAPSAISRSAGTSMPGTSRLSSARPLASVRCAPASPAPCARRLRVSSSSRRRDFTWSERRCTPARTSARGAFSARSTSSMRCSSSTRRSWMPGPVTASMRRTPAATPRSERMRRAPICSVLSQCVPPQSSTDHGASGPSTVTTRTVSPYFSPNMAIAPLARASW